MNVKGVLLGGFLSGVVIFAVWMIVSVVVQVISPYDVLSLGGMRAKDDPIMLLFFLHPWVMGFAMAMVYSQVGKAFEGSVVQKGVRFGLVMWLLGGLPSAFVVFTSMNYPLAFTVSSVVSSLLHMPAAGVVIAKFMK